MALYTLLMSLVMLTYTISIMTGGESSQFYLPLFEAVSLNLNISRQTVAINHNVRPNVGNRFPILFLFLKCCSTKFPKSLAQFYIECCYTEMGKTSWTYSSFDFAEIKKGRYSYEISFMVDNRFININGIMLLIIELILDGNS